MINVSIVIPSFNARLWVEECLNSLKAQSYAYELFEIIVVFNGPDDGTIEYVETFSKVNPLLNFCLLHSEIASATTARNIGANNARGKYLTWIDVDDWISPEYIELLASSVDDQMVPFAQIINVTPNGKQEALNAINGDLYKMASPRVHPTDFVRAMTFMTAKMLPTKWVLEIPFSEDLRSGEDVAFYGELMARFDFRLNLMPAAAGAVYYRRLTATSVSRGNGSRDFLVTQRAQVIDSLSKSCLKANKKVRASLEGMMRSQASFIKRYISDHLEERVDVIDELVTMKIGGFPWQVLQDAPKSLVIAYNFAPYSDTGAVVASKRIRANGKSVDVISNNMSNVRTSNKDNLLLSEPYVAWREEIQRKAYFGSEESVEEFINSGLSIVEKWKARGRNYESLYSRSMWPASHFLAAAIKIQNPNIFWTAEFSDPARMTTSGTFRSSPITSETLKKFFLNHGPKLFSMLLNENPDVFHWSEMLPYLFADELVFTNRNQQLTMLGYAPEPVVKLIEQKSIIRHQPTLPRAYYSLGNRKPDTFDHKINVGYFGDFYNTRGLSEVISALEMLDDNQLDELSVWIFSSDSSSVKRGLPRRISERIFFRERVTYFEFLGLLDRFQCLIVNDAFTSDHHAVNPYLPSKLSDYRGSSSKLWGIVEAGSVLSNENLDFKSAIGSISGAYECLLNILESSKAPVV